MTGKGMDLKMYNYSGNSYEAYKQQSVMTMTKGEMLVKLYDEVIKQLGSAVRGIEEKDYTTVNKALQKSQRIIGYLDTTLDARYELSASLSALYEFFIHQTVTANMSKDASLIAEIIPMVQELRDSFSQAEKISRMSQSGAAASPTLMSAVG